MMQGLSSPAEPRSPITESPGQEDVVFVVIMASTVWPPSLKERWLSTSAGRRLLPSVSAKGNGTTTTSQGSQITERLFVLRRIPFVQSRGERCVEGDVEGLDSLQHHFAVTDLIADQVPGREPQRPPNLARDLDLSVAR